MLGLILWVIGGILLWMHVGPGAVGAAFVLTAALDGPYSYSEEVEVK